jgi:hypothetical protein
MPFQYGHKVRVGGHCRRWPAHLEFGGLWEWRRVPRDRSHQGRAGGSSPFVGPEDFVTGLWWHHSPGASGGIPGHCGRWPPAQQNRECCARRRGRVRALTSSASIGRAVWHLAGAAAAVAVISIARPAAASSGKGASPALASASHLGDLAVISTLCPMHQLRQGDSRWQWAHLARGADLALRRADRAPAGRVHPFEVACSTAGTGGHYS